MTDEEKITALREALAGAVGAIDALAHIIESGGHEKTAKSARDLSVQYLQVLTSTNP